MLALKDVAVQGLAKVVQTSARVDFKLFGR